MRRLLLAAAVAGAVVTGAPGASACTVDNCWFTQPVCSRVNCHVCYYEPPGVQRCIT